MKRLFITALTLLLVSTKLISQSCLPDGIEFTTQSQIDNFTQNYPDCKIIEGNVLILGPDITNLHGLFQLTKIEGYLAIGDYMNGNKNLYDLEGLNNITEINALQIEGNENLTDLSGLDSLETINYGLWVDYNARIKDLGGMNNLKTINGHIQINTNYSLASISALSNIPSQNIELLLIEHNDSLSNCEIESVCNIISDSVANIHIYMNGEGCQNYGEVKEACNSLGLPNTINRDISFFPNPANKKITVSIPYSNENYDLRIFNNLGELKLNQLSLKRTVDISTLSSGLYIIEIEVGDCVYKDKLLIIR